MSYRNCRKGCSRFFTVHLHQPTSDVIGNTASRAFLSDSNNPLQRLDTPRKAWKKNMFMFSENVFMFLKNILMFSSKHQHLLFVPRCDLLKNYYLCRENNNCFFHNHLCDSVVICLKTTIFAERTTTNHLHNQYQGLVVICLKTTIFAERTTTKFLYAPIP